MNLEHKRILILNRGEIAIRIAKAINELGHVSVGICTDNETSPPHLQYCQEWVHLPGSTNLETYLNIEKILEIVLTYKIDAVHPGYGFLSENTDFSLALKKAGVIFIGPNAEAIRKMGDKAISKKMAKEVGVPVVPGSVGEIKNIDDALKLAKEIGYPILLKAIAGGGGRGMRVCIDEKEVKKNFEVVQREALKSFKNGALLVEKYIVDPHHIEVQILADKKGNIFHLFERECSVQRRHQKIIEEAPSPFIGDDEKLREDICNTAVKLARQVGYDSVGTVEFIMGSDRRFYFLEMNTRIQVEHPITEEITACDLVTLMIQIAFNEEIPIKKQSDVKKLGHAIECRICAEDPITMLPAPGFLESFQFEPPQGSRFDHCLVEKYNISPDFDPMIGKLITKGLNRDIAIRKMKAALNGLVIQGLKTNIILHRIILEDAIFKKGNYSTSYLIENKINDKIETNIEIQDLVEHTAVMEMLYQEMGK